MTERETPITHAYSEWRTILPVHPAAEIIPEYTEEKKIALGRMIKMAGRMNVPVIVFYDPGSGTFTLGDGRSRLDALVAVGIKFVIRVADGKVNIVAEGIEVPEPQIITIADGFDPYAFVAATNVGRRHLNAAEKRAIAGKLITARPELTDRAIAKLASIDHKTVAAIRREIAYGDNPHCAERVEKTGHKARGRKPAVQKLPVVEPVTVVAKVEPAAAPAAKAKPAVVPAFDAAEVLAAVRKVLAVLDRPVSGPNHDEARKEIQHVIALLAPSAKPSTVRPPATTNARLNRDALGRALGYAA